MRPSVDVYFMQMAALVATRSTCARRSVGCVLVDEKNRVLATGYNGVPSGFQHCNEWPCPGAASPSGKDLDLCMAIHAEANAVVQCSNTDRIHTAYCTTRPCTSCQKLLVNTGCVRIVYRDGYVDETNIFALAGRIIEKANQ